MDCKNESEIEIEEIKIEDYGRLKDIIREQQLYHYQLNGPYKERFLRINEKNFQEYMMRKAKSITYVAVIEDTIIGFSSAYINHHNESLVEDLFISESYRNKSIGTKLFQKLLMWLENNHVETIDIHVSIGNESVIQFYEKNDFKMTGYSLKKVNEHIDK